MEGEGQLLSLAWMGNSQFATRGATEAAAPRGRRASSRSAPTLGSRQFQLVQGFSFSLCVSLYLSQLLTPENMEPWLYYQQGGLRKDLLAPLLE